MSVRGMTTQSDTVHTLEAGCQNDQFGVPISLIGQISSVCVFHEALTLNHVRNMYLLGRYLYHCVGTLIILTVWDRQAFVPMVKKLNITFLV